MKKYTLLLFLFAFYISSLPVYGALPSCNVKVVASSTVSIDALPKTCTVEKLKGVTPYELGGVSPLYLIS